MNTETPQTDTLWDKYLKGYIITTRDLFNFARRLERQRDEAREWQAMLSSWGGTPEIVNNFIKGQQSRIHAAQNIEEQMDELREKLANVIHDLADERALADRLAGFMRETMTDEDLPLEWSDGCEKHLKLWEEARHGKA